MHAPDALAPAGTGARSQCAGEGSNEDVGARAGMSQTDHECDGQIEYPRRRSAVISRSQRRVCSPFGARRADERERGGLGADGGHGGRRSSWTDGTVTFAAANAIRPPRDAAGVTSSETERDELIPCQRRRMHACTTQRPDHRCASTKRVERMYPRRDAGNGGPGRRLACLQGLLPSPRSSSAA